MDFATMHKRPSTVTMAEAAVLAGISLREVNRVFDEGIFPEPLVRDEAGRRIERGAVPLLAFYFGTAGALEASARRSVIKTIVNGRGGLSSRRLATLRRFRGTLPVAPGVSVTIAPFIAETDDRERELDRARAIVVEDPEILGGLPVIRGTRIPVHDVAGSIAAGIDRGRLLVSYPGLNSGILDLAVLYAQAHPLRGRPPRPDDLRLRTIKRVLRSQGVGR